MTNESDLVPLHMHNLLTVGPAPWTDTRVPAEAFNVARAVYGTSSEDDDKRVYRTVQAALWKVGIQSTTAVAAPQPEAADNCEISDKARIAMLEALIADREKSLRKLRDAAPQPEATPKNRREFEVHAAERGFELERYPQGPYVSFITDKHWETWRAALAAPSAQPDPAKCPHTGQCHPGFCQCSDVKRADEDYKQAHGAKNCMQCAAAYMLGLPLSSVPDFEKAGPDAWESFYAFFAKHSFTAEMFQPRVEIEGDYLASGTTERGTNHMVVMRNGTLLHDPHPSNAGLTSLQAVWVIARKAQAEQGDPK